MSVSIAKGLNRSKGLSFIGNVFSEGIAEFEEETGDFILYEDDTSILLEDVGSSFVKEVDPELYILTEDGDPLVLEDTSTPLETE